MRITSCSWHWGTYLPPPPIPRGCRSGTVLPRTPGLPRQPSRAHSSAPRTAPWPRSELCPWWGWGGGTRTGSVRHGVPGSPLLTPVALRGLMAGGVLEGSPWRPWLGVLGHSPCARPGFALPGSPASLPPAAAPPHRPAPALCGKQWLPFTGVGALEEVRILVTHVHGFPGAATTKPLLPPPPSAGGPRPKVEVTTGLVPTAGEAPPPR